MRRSNDPRSLCDGRNPNGLNFFVPRKREAVASKFKETGTDGAERNVARRAPRGSVLACEAASASLDSFLGSHLPTLREAERLAITITTTTDLPSSASVDSECPPGLLQDGKRMEASGIMSQTSIIEIARKWRCLTGKWLLFVPEWRIDGLFLAVSRRLRDGALPGCSGVVVSPPGAFGMDPNKYMLSARTVDFTDQQQTMRVGKQLRLAAREGLRCPIGDWGELRDDPFAAPGKKVTLAFKPDVYTHLGIHRNNSHGIRPALYILDL